jgi:hypothetical protein
LDYVEIPVVAAGGGPQQVAPADSAPEPDSLSDVSSITRMAKKMSVSLSGDCLSSLREAVARHHKASVTSERSVEDQSSDTEDCDDLATDKPSDSEELPEGGGSPLSEVDVELTERSPAGSPDRSPLSGPDRSPLPGPDQVDSGGRMDQPSSSLVPEINITEDSFVVVEAPVEEVGVEALATPAVGGEPAMITGDGYAWSRQLVFRAKLTMHTAFERSDNSEPAAVTALAVSKDHRNLYVGDDRGRVFSWQVSNKPGKGNMVLDEDHDLRCNHIITSTLVRIRYSLPPGQHQF